VGAAELRDRIVAVLAEHAAVEPLRPLERRPDGRRRSRPPALRRDLVGELVEEQPAERLGRPRVAGEQRPFHRLGQIGQHEDMAIDVAEERGEPRPLVVGERLRDAGSRQRGAHSGTTSRALQ
jgi:hypothetical protein